LRGVRAREPLKDLLELRRRDSVAVVGDRDHREVAVTVRRQGDLAVLVRVLDGVLHQRVEPRP